MTFDSAEQKPFFPLDGRIALRRLGLAGQSQSFWSGATANISRARRVRAEIRRARPDVVISFLNTVNVTVLLATIGLRVPVIISERTDPVEYPLGRPWRALRRWLYPLAGALVVQSPSVHRFFEPWLRERCRIIPNPVSFVSAEPLSARNPGSVALIAMGRFTEEKGFDLLLRAFALVSGRYENCSLTIWGDGPDRPKLEVLRRDLGLEHRVLLPGRTSDAVTEFRKSHIYVLPSRFEGFPNALCEAMASGLPVISTDCPSGPRHIITHEVDGLLVPVGDPAALAGAIERLLHDSSLRERLGTAAAKIVDRFSLGKVMALWDDVIAQAERTR